MELTCAQSRRSSYKTASRDLGEFRDVLFIGAALATSDSVTGLDH